MSKDEEMIDIEVNCDKEIADRINKMTKSELRGAIVGLSLANKEQQKIEKKLRTEVETLTTKLDKAETHVEQGRAMVLAVMDRWYEYDV